MELGLKNLFSRKRSKSRPAAAREPSQDSLWQTSAYSTVQAGPMPQVGALPLKPSLEKQPRKSFSHIKARSDGQQQLYRAAESANTGRPRTSPGVKPYFVGVSKPAGSGIISGVSAPRPSVDVGAAEDPARPPLPPLPKDLDSLKRPRYYDIMHFASKQQSLRASFNERVAARNMGLPRKSVDIFETELNQLSRGRYNEYVAMHNIERTRQAIDHFEEDVALRNAALHDTQPARSESPRASTEASRYRSRANSKGTAASKAPGQRLAGVENSANTQASSIGKGKPATTRNGSQVAGLDATSRPNIPRSQDDHRPKLALYSRQHSSKQNYHSRELSPISQSRSADFMPPEWLNHGKTAMSSVARTRSMTVSIPPRLPNGSPTDLQHSVHGRDHRESRTLPERLGDARNQHSQHNTSKSLSALEGPSGQDALSPATFMGQRSVPGEHSTLQEIPLTRASNTAKAGVPWGVSDASTGSATSSRPPSTGGSPASSIRKRLDGSRRTVMDLTYEYADRRTHNAGHPVYYELSGELSPKMFYDNLNTNTPHETLKPTLTYNSQQPGISVSGTFQSLPGPKPILSHVSSNDENKQATATSLARERPGTESVAAVRESTERTMSRSTSQSAGVSDGTTSSATSYQSQGSLANESSAGKSHASEQRLHEDPDQQLSRHSEHVYETPDSLKSSDFTNPSRAFGVAARDFAVPATPEQSQGTLKKISQTREEARSHKPIPRFVSKIPVRRDKVLRHISSFTVPAKQPQGTQSTPRHITFDEYAFQLKQAKAHAALEQDLQENLAVALDSLNHASIQAAPVPFRDPSIRGGSVPPPPHVSSTHVPTSIYQNKANSNASYFNALADERIPQWGPSNLDLAMTKGNLAFSVHVSPRNGNRNSTISTISETEVERPSSVQSTPAPTVPFSSLSDWGRSMTSRPFLRRSTASTGSARSAFSIPPHWVPERTSSIRDDDLPAFTIGDTQWE